MASVFLSYDHEDARLAAPIAAALEKAGYSVWWDRNIHGGAEYNNEIENAVERSDVVVVLWSQRSIRSAWVRDEAAEGRDQGKLVPVSLDGTKPPMGFRQYQTLELNDWTARRRSPAFDELLNAISVIARRAKSDPGGPGPAKTGGETGRSPAPAGPARRPARKWWMAAAAIALLALLAGGAFYWLKRPGLPVVEISAADSSPRSRAAANDLYVKLGMQAQVGGGKWQLVDSESAPDRPDFIFRTADLGTPREPRANLVLVDGRSRGLLWSREFDSKGGTEADLRHQLALTAARVLGCALESRAAGGLKRDLLRLFLDSCGLLADSSFHQYEAIMPSLRKVVAAKPDFMPAWSRLLEVQMVAIDMTGNEVDRSAQLARLRKDVDHVEKHSPTLPELALARAFSLPANAYGARLALLERAIAASPDHPQLLGELSAALMSVGRMGEAIAAAQRAAELDPLSPRSAGQFIMVRAYGGQVESAREKLREMERLWAGTGALRDVQWGFHLRFGDPELARKLAAFSAASLDLYLAARSDPSPEKIARLRQHLTRLRNKPDGVVPEAAGMVQAMGEFAMIEDLFDFLEALPAEVIAGGSDVLFRPALAEARRDPRFIAVARRIGLADYWQKSGKWPDFCNDPGLPYDCRKEAARLG